ncbi:MAG: hypothetical protein QW179_01290 [Candidatus Hadarchaeales archaeon]
MCHVFQNFIDIDTSPREGGGFRGYVFASFLGLPGYYLVLRALKKAEINSKVGVADLMLELSSLRERTPLRSSFLSKHGVFEAIESFGAGGPND